jgi:predicted nucleotidyltransferase component of viral defense system
MDGYPRSFNDLARWATSNGVTIEEARRRFIQHILLCAIASVRPLRQGLVFKGGNALDFVLQPNRSTLDLDFSVDMTTGSFPLDAGSIETLLGRGLHVVSTRFDVALAIHSVRQHPPGTGRTFATFEARVGYALPDERQLIIRMANNQTSPHVLPIEVSINEPIVDSTVFSIRDDYPQLRISTLEDIVGEKLRALLQQPIRNRNRRQDLLDIAVVVQANPAIDRAIVAAALQTKAEARHVPVSRAAFHAPAMIDRTEAGYADLAATTRVVFIPFDEALAIVLRLVDELAIPES